MSQKTEVVLVPDITLAPWRDLDGAAMGVVERICGIPGGTTEGLASVGLAVKLQDGTVILAQTTLRLFIAAAVGLSAAYEDEGLPLRPCFHCGAVHVPGANTLCDDGGTK